ncbi:CLCN5, partial [Symbiodinium necroappetens]
LKEVLFKSAETLAVSPQDVRFHKWESAKGGLGVFFFLEVENPFVQHDEPEEWFSIDDWFASLPVPVDEIRIMTQSQLYPPGPQPAPTPFLDPWLPGAWVASCRSNRGEQQLAVVMRPLLELSCLCLSSYSSSSYSSWRCWWWRWCARAISISFLAKLPWGSP